jgi:hypothetical protein
MRRPATLEPVKVTLSTPGLRTRCSVALERCLRRRLQDEGAARDHRRRQLDRREVQRRVPGHDPRHHAYGLAHQQSAPSPHARRVLLLEIEGVRHCGVLLEIALTGECAVLRHAVQSADLVGPGVGQFDRTRHEPLAEATHVCGALRVGQARPRAVIEGRTGGGDRAIHVRLARLGDLEDDLFGNRRNDLDHVAAGGRHPLATDEQLVEMLDVDGLKALRDRHRGSLEVRRRFSPRG